MTNDASADWYHAECLDPDHSGFFESQADAETCVGDHGGKVTALWEGPMSTEVQYVQKLESVLCRLMHALPAPKSKTAAIPYLEALVMAAQIEGRADFYLCSGEQHDR